MLKSMKEFYLKYKEIIHYLIAGGLTTVVSLGTYYLCVLTFLDPRNGFQLQAANVISWICAVTFAYFVNRSFVFESRSKDYLREAGAFVAGRIGTLLMDMAIMFILVTLLHCNDKIAKLVVQVVVTIANYVISKIFVFHK
ncbi:MAG: GtrA family protein [Lachnospiraceae bacterium]